MPILFVFMSDIDFEGDFQTFICSYLEAKQTNYPQAMTCGAVQVALIIKQLMNNGCIKFHLKIFLMMTILYPVGQKFFTKFRPEMYFMAHINEN